MAATCSALSDLVSSSPGCFPGEELMLVLPEVPGEGKTAPAEGEMTQGGVTELIFGGWVILKKEEKIRPVWPPR